VDKWEEENRNGNGNGRWNALTSSRCPNHRLQTRVTQAKIIFQPAANLHKRPIGCKCIYGIHLTKTEKLTIKRLKTVFDMSWAMNPLRQPPFFSYIFLVFWYFPLLFKYRTYRKVKHVFRLAFPLGISFPLMKMHGSNGEKLVSSLRDFPRHLGLGRWKSQRSSA